MTRRDNLDALPFDDYADPDPHGQLRIGDDGPTDADILAELGLDEDAETVTDDLGGWF